MTEQEFLSRYDAGQPFTESQISAALWNFPQLDEIEGDDHRWDREITTVILVGDRTFSVEWRRGLTECQEDSFFGSCFVEVEKHMEQKLVTVTTWEPVRVGAGESAI